MVTRCEHHEGIPLGNKQNGKTFIHIQQNAPVVERRSLDAYESLAAESGPGNRIAAALPGNIGLSGSGKTTICRATHRRLVEKGIEATVLDGEAFRERSSKDLVASPEATGSRILRRMSAEASRFNQNGLVVLIAAISPYRDIRDEIRAQHRSFLEVFVNAPLQVCEERDPKGLYQRARAGLIDDFTGVSSPYEEPLNADLECRTHQESVEQCCVKVVNAIERLMQSSQRLARRS